MKKILISLTFTMFCFFANSQSCDEYIKFVKSKSYGSSYSSYNSKAISKVTFYNAMIDYQTYYFAIVCFKENEYSSNCSEYIYQVSYSTQGDYSMNYLNSAGKAFWKYIEPYNQNLDCAPNFN